MSSLIAVLLFAILFNTDVYCLSVRESTDSNEETNFTSTSNSFDAILGGQKVTHGPKTKTHALIESLPGELNQTDLPVAGNDSFGTPIVGWFNTSVHNGSTILVWLNESHHNESTEANDHNTTEARFDDDGCDTHLRNKHEDDCFENLEQEINKAMDMEDEAEKGRHICCSSEGYERCCIIGYRQANCAADHQAIKENLKAARMFVATLTDTSCAIHRGKCGFNSAATLSPLYSIVLVTLGLLPIAFLL